MKKFLNSPLGKLLVRLYHDERGAEKLEYLLIVAAIALPLLGILLMYRNALVSWLSGEWENVSNPDSTDVPNPQLP